MSSCEMSGSEKSGWGKSWSESSGCETPGPKGTCAKRLCPTWPCLQRPGVKHAARFSDFVKLKSIKYHFNVVEGKSGIRVTKAVDVVFCSTLPPHFVTPARVTKCVARATQSVKG